MNGGPHLVCIGCGEVEVPPCQFICASCEALLVKSGLVKPQAPALPDNNKVQIGPTDI